jgi:NADPH:quinone reductase
MMMKAYGVTEFGTDTLEQVCLPDPMAAAGQVLIRNASAGVNYIDLLIRQGLLPAEATPLPHVLGVEGAGVIEDVGPEVDDLRIGDRVMWLGNLGAGGYGPYTAIDATYVAKIADNVSFEIAAAAPVAYATARNVIFSYCAADPGAWVLVHSAAGGVGVAALHVARNAGLRTIALASSGKLNLVRSQGATIAIDRRSPDLVDRILDATGGTGVALSLNSVGGPTILQDLKVLSDFGQIISFGHLGGAPEGTASDLLSPYFAKSIGIRVSDLYTFWRSRKSAFRAMLLQIATDLESGSITPQVHAVSPIAEALIAHETLRSGRAMGKLVLRHAT